MKSLKNKWVIGAFLLFCCVIPVMVALVDSGLRGIGVLPTHTPEPTATITPTPLPPTETSPPTNTLPPTETPEPTSPPAPTDTPEPTATLTESESLEALLSAGLNTGELVALTIAPGADIVTVEWDISPSFNDEMTRNAAKFDLQGMLEAVQDSGLEYGRVDFVGFADLVDTSGNSQRTAVVKAFYNKSTVDNINFSNFLSDNVYVIADELDLHPLFQE